MQLPTGWLVAWKKPQKENNNEPANATAYAPN